MSVTPTLDLCPFDELNHDLPERCWVLRVRGADRYACYCDDGVHGLCAFVDMDVVIAWRYLFDVQFDVLTVGTSELLELAKTRPEPINAIHVMDKAIANPAHTFYFR